MGQTQEFVDRINSNYDYWLGLYLTSSLREFCIVLGCGESSIGNVIRELGWGRDFKRIEKYKRLKFPISDEEVKWYFAGYVLGDGTIRKRKNATEVNVYSSETEILYRFATELQVECKEVSSKGSGQYAIRSVNPKLYEWLYNIGIRPNKSNVGCYVQVPIERRSDFLRGLLDSDGHVHVNKDIVLFLGHPSYMKQVYDWLIRFNVTYREQDSLAIVTCCNRKGLEELFHYLYDDTTIKLDRKYSEFRKKTESARVITDGE